MTAHSTASSKFYIGTTKACATAADFASDAWTEVTDVADFGEAGDTFEEIKVNSVGDPRTRKLKGTVDGGDRTITVNRNISDPGQLAMLAAVPVRANYNFKVANSDGSVDYVAGPVMESQTKLGGPNNVVQITFKVAISSDTVTVLAA